MSYDHLRLYYIWPYRYEPGTCYHQTRENIRCGGKYSSPVIYGMVTGFWGTHCAGYNSHRGPIIAATRVCHTEMTSSWLSALRYYVEQGVAWFRHMV